ncbi:Mismatch repair protein msh3 [Dimargaris cristalligena]|nr:Mismatch repair protein msh3 [Dimargaris cristalligena]
MASPPSHKSRHFGPNPTSLPTRSPIFTTNHPNPPPLKRTRTDESRTDSPTPQPSPLEQQYRVFKARYPDCILALEVGNWYRFFEADAQTVAQVLAIQCHLNSRGLYTASVPACRIQVHIRRLVWQGHKVGIVRQAETAALKAAGDHHHPPSSGRLFTRTLDALYTRGTWVEPMTEPTPMPTPTPIPALPSASAPDSCSSPLVPGDPADIQEGAGVTPYLVCVVDHDTLCDEDPVDPQGQRQRRPHAQVGLLALCATTGDVVYDAFTDTPSRTELETRLAHFDLGEVVWPDHISHTTRKMVQRHLGRIAASGPLAVVRTETRPSRFTSYPDALTFVTSQAGAWAQTLHTSTLFLLQLPHLVLVALAYLTDYLIDFQLHALLYRTSYYTPFRSQFYLKLGGHTLRQLEIISPLSSDGGIGGGGNGGRVGSLWWTLDHTHTPFGRRMLKHWVQYPLADLARLTQRRAALDELVQYVTGNSWTDTIRKVLKTCPDLDRGLARIQLLKCTPPELSRFLRSWGVLTLGLTEPVVPSHIQSRLLLDPLGACRSIRNHLRVLLHGLDLDAADRDDAQGMLGPASIPELETLQKAIAETERCLEEYLIFQRQEINCPKLRFVQVGDVPYQLEVAITGRSKVPGDWVQVSGTRRVSRFHPPFVIQRLGLIQRNREKIQHLVNEAYQAYLRRLGTHHDLFRDTIRQLAGLDCLCSLAVVARQPGYTRPNLVGGTHGQTSVIHLEGLVHPVLRLWQAGGVDYVRNDITLGEVSSLPDSPIPSASLPLPLNHARALVLTGPNMGGKSCFIKAVALLCIMAHMGSYLPARSARLSLLDAVYTRMGGADDIIRGQSTFMVEMQETADLLQQATPRSLVLLDELGRGTSTIDGQAIAYAVLRHLVQEVRCLTLFVTHYTALADWAAQRGSPTIDASAQVENEPQDPSLPTAAYYMDYRLVPTASAKFQGNNVVFLYEAVPGVNRQSYGLNVARMALMPESVLAKARDMAISVQGPYPPKSDTISQFIRLLRQTQVPSDEATPMEASSHDQNTSL